MTTKTASTISRAAYIGTCMSCMYQYICTYKTFPLYAANQIIRKTYVCIYIYIYSYILVFSYAFMINGKFPISPFWGHPGCEVFHLRFLVGLQSSENLCVCVYIYTYIYIYIYSYILVFSWAFMINGKFPISPFWGHPGCEVCHLRFLVGLQSSENLCVCTYIHIYIYIRTFLFFPGLS
jgi:hypothetical protein